MESTPGLDSDVPLTPAGALQYPPSSVASSSAMHNPNTNTTEQHSNGASTSQPSSSGHKFSNGPHIRSRITVVCAECKRLKLKCDRRTPCSSCLKRDTVQRCVYSQAAAEKVDVQTLHNRIIEIERVIAQLQAAPSTSVSPMAGFPAFKPSVLAVPGPSRSGHSLLPSPSNLLAGLPYNDRALLAQGASGSSLVINLEDVVSLWLSELDDFGLDTKLARISGSDTSSPARPLQSNITVKLEPAPVSIPPAPSTCFSPGNGSQTPVGGFSILHPPAPYDAFLPPTSTATSTLPQVTTALFSYLPTEPARSHYLKAFRETMLLHPSFNVPHFEHRLAAIFTWAEHGEGAACAVPAYGKPPMSKQDLARDIFFSGAKPGNAPRAAATPGSGPPNSGGNLNAPKPTLSFFSAVCSAFALGSLVSRDEDPPDSSSASSLGTTERNSTPAMLFALSEQALHLFEKTAAYDLDSVIAMILQVLYMLHEGGVSVAQSVFPLVGKMVNVARMMGLAMDPDEFPGTYNLFEAETRRRVWWEVYYYDLFVADAMGHPPLIADNTHTTRLPADVEEDKFTPSCMSLPDPEGTPDELSSAYFGLKLRLAQLVKNVKKQTFRDPIGANDEVAELSIDHASSFEGEVRSFLQDLPASFKLEMTQDIAKPIPADPSSGPTAPIQLAQKCELTILANRLVVKLYLPFLKQAAATQKPSHQAVFGTISAAHNIIYASRVLHSVWGQTRPAIFDFYDFARTLFDAAIVCAHAVIQEPASIVALEGMKSVACALDVLKELGSCRAGVEGTRADNSRNEAVRIVEMMKHKAEVARSSGGSAAAAGTKRKHGEVEGETLSGSSSNGGSFQLPFVGAAVSSCKTDRVRSSASATMPRMVALTSPPMGKDAAARTDAKKQGKDKRDDREKPPKYATGPLRVRPMTGQPGPRRQRTASVSVASASTPVPVAPAPPPPPSVPLTSASAPASVLTTPPSGNGLPPSSSSQSQARSAHRSSISIPLSPMDTSAHYDMYVPSAPTPTQPQQTQQSDHHHHQQVQEDYNMQYSSSPDGSGVDERRYSGAQSSYDSPQSAGPIYEPQSQVQYVQNSANGYPSAPSQQPNGYYMPYSGQQQPTTNGFEGHAMMGMMPPPPVDASGAGASSITPAMATIAHSYVNGAQQVPPRQIEYQQAQSQHQHQHHAHHQQQQQPQTMAAMPSHMQGWVQQPGEAAWSKYEYNSGWSA